MKITKGLPIPHSPSMVELDKKVFNTYGDYYQYEVEELEDLAYKELREDTPIHRARKKLRKRTNTSVEITQTDTPIIETGTPKKTLKTKKGLKPIKRNTKVELI